MAEKTLYTALGHFRCRNDGGGRRYPVILMDHREFGMDPQEMTIWTALCWRLTDRQRAEDFYEQLSNGMELFPRRSFSDCLDRLVTRGLVAKGSGTTDFDALYDLLGGLYVVPVSSSFPLKVVTFLKLLCSGTAPGPAAALFRRDRRTEPERHIMALSRCAPLSTAELVRCAERDISAAVGSQQTLALLYGDQETTSDNIVSAWRTTSSSASWRFSTPMIASQADADRSVPKRDIPQRHFGRCAIPTDGASAAGCLPLSKSRRPNIRNGDWSWSCRRRSRMPFPK